MVEGIDGKYPTDELIAALKKNREIHAACVAEAKAGYVREAKALLKERIEKLQEYPVSCQR